MIDKEEDKHDVRAWIKTVLQVAKRPLLVIFITYIVYLLTIYFSPLVLPGFYVEIKAIMSVIVQIILTLCIYWFFLRSIDHCRFQLQLYFKRTGRKVSFFLLDFFINTLKVIILLSLFSFIIDLLPLPVQYNYFVEKIISIFVIAAIASVLIKLVKVIEALISAKYNIDTRDDLPAQKARTQILILGRISIGLILVISFGAILLLFENVRNLGTSILTSAGILSLIGGFAIQRPLKNLADSLQVIFSQMIKINDLVIIEKEFGSIEEINSSYVVIKVWDMRRLIIPISYFVEKPFISLSRTSTEILGVVKLYVDYSLPVQKIREALKEIVRLSPFWDGRVCNLNVTDSKEATMELRIDISARTPADSWNLQCEVREKLIQIICEHYPDSLPKMRPWLNQSNSE